jgi:CreA protein
MRQHYLQDAVAERQGLHQPVRRSEGAGGDLLYLAGAEGRLGQPFGLNEDPSNFSVSCRQMGPITIDLKTLPEHEEAFTEKTSIFFKKTRIYRIPDISRNALVYLAISAKLIEGSPANSVSAVPIMPWPKP